MGRRKKKKEKGGRGKAETIVPSIFYYAESTSLTIKGNTTCLPAFFFKERHIRDKDVRKSDLSGAKGMLKEGKEEAGPDRRRLFLPSFRKGKRGGMGYHNHIGADQGKKRGRKEGGKRLIPP